MGLPGPGRLARLAAGTALHVAATGVGLAAGTAALAGSLVAPPVRQARATAGAVAESAVYTATVLAKAGARAAGAVYTLTPRQHPPSHAPGGPEVRPGNRRVRRCRRRDRCPWRRRAEPCPPQAGDRPGPGNPRCSSRGRRGGCPPDLTPYSAAGAVPVRRAARRRSRHRPAGRPRSPARPRSRRPACRTASSWRGTPARGRRAWRAGAARPAPRARGRARRRRRVGAELVVQLLQGRVAGGGDLVAQPGQQVGPPRSRASDARGQPVGVQASRSTLHGGSRRAGAQPAMSRATAAFASTSSQCRSTTSAG